MMDVFINEQRIAELDPGPALVGEIIEAVKVHVDPSRVVTRVELDGEAFDAGDEASFTGRAARQLERLALTTHSADEIASDLGEKVRAALEIILFKVEATAELLNGGQTREGLEVLADLSEELRLALVLDQQVSQLSPARLSLPVGEMETMGRALVAAQEGNRLGDVSAVLARELAPVLRTWLDRSSAGVSG